VLDAVLGDRVTEIYGRCLASVCDGKLEPLKTLFEDTQASFWSRVAALNAMVVRVMEGDAAREEVVQYLAKQGDMQARRLRAPDAVRDDLEVLDWIVEAACDLCAVEWRERIQNWADEGVLEMSEEDMTWLVDSLSQPFEVSRQYMLTKGKGYVRDVVKEMSWWLCFQDSSAKTDASGRNFPNFLSQPVEAVVRSGPKVGRNDPCPCGSGKETTPPSTRSTRWNLVISEQTNVVPF